MDLSDDEYDGMGYTAGRRRRVGRPRSGSKTARPRRRVGSKRRVGGRKPSAWNLFAKKVYKEEKRKHPHFTFADALVKASRKWKGKGVTGGSKRRRRVGSKRRVHRRSGSKRVSRRRRTHRRR